jgi:hypothetical protein
MAPRLLIRPAAADDAEELVCANETRSLTIWNVLLGIAVMLWAFGWTQMRDLLAKSRCKPAHEPAAP